MRRSICVIAISLCLLLGMVGNAFAEKLVIGSFFPVNQVSGWDGLVKEFKSTHPDVEIEVQVTAGDDYLPKLLTQIVSGTAPDIIAVENTPFPEFVDKQVLADLTPFLERTPDFSIETFFPRLLDRYTVNERIYGIPYDLQPNAMLLYSKPLFQEAGLSFPTEEWTWEDALAAALKLTKVSGNRTVQYGYDPQSNWQYFVYSNGGAVVDDVKDPKTCRLHEQAAIDGVQWLVDLINKHKVTPSPSFIQSSGMSSTDLLLTGRVGMSQGGFWTVVEHAEAMNRFNIGMQIAPKGLTGTRAYPTGGTAFGITRTCKNPTLAWEFLTYHLGPVGTRTSFEAAPYGAIYPPAHIPSFEWYVQESTVIENIDANAKAAEYVIFNPFTGKWPEINTRYIQPEIDLVLRGRKDVEPTMKSISKDVTEALNE
jgi:multiple sugar transport system substrate-binding protein